MHKKYIILFSVLFISLGVTFYAPIESLFKGLAAMPAVGALFGVLIQIIRDDAAHVRKQEIIEFEKKHNIGSASHMANTVFDKQVEFAEKYSKVVIKAFNHMRSTADLDKAHEFASELTLLRLDYMCWLTDTADEELDAFEKKLRRCGVSSKYIKFPKGEGTIQEHRDKAAVEMLEIHAAFISIFETSKEHPEASIISISNKLRRILGVEELVSIKNSIIEKSS